jgi:glycosyltransferase involved in cell wall biosynthesis
VTVDRPVPAGLTGLAVSYLAASTAGGTGQHVLMLASGCAARGATVTVYGPAALSPPRGPDSAVLDSAAGATARPAGWRFELVEIADRPRPARDTAAVLRLRRLLARDRPGALHAHGLRAGAVAALALAGRGRRDTALVVTVHNAAPPGRAAAALYAGLELIVARRADAVLAVSGDLADGLRRRGARDVARAVVPAPDAVAATAADATAVRRELGATGQAARPVVLAAGRLAPQKDFGTLLRAAAQWQRRDPVPLLVIAGDGPLAATLRRQAAADGVAARFLGHRRDVPALLAAADVVAVPSQWEGQPLIVQEALRAGRPLVASRAGGIPELTGEDGAVLVPPGDPAALAAAVTRLLDDPAAAVAQAAAARARAAALPTGREAVDQVAAVYQRLARAVRPGRAAR